MCDSHVLPATTLSQNIGELAHPVWLSVLVIESQLHHYSLNESVTSLLSEYRGPPSGLTQGLYYIEQLKGSVQCLRITGSYCYSQERMMRIMAAMRRGIKET